MSEVPYQYNLALRFERVAAAYPASTAIAFDPSNQISYEDLNSRANQMAHFLLAEGVKKGDVVGIFNNKSVFGYSAMLACLKIGAIYVNLDVSSPAQRLDKILERAAPVLLLNDFAPQTYINSPEIKQIDLARSDFQDRLSGFSQQNPSESRAITGANPAYLMFTSGSTGFPKGAVISHANVLNFIQWGIETFQITTADRFTNVNPIYFDNSVFDFYVSLFSGATLVPIAGAVSENPGKLLQQVDEMACTIWFSVPSLLVYLLTTRALKQTNFRSIRKIIFGGEGFPKPKLKNLFDLYHQRAELVNVYGPTECTCICSAYLISEEDFRDLKQLAPLGFLAPNFDYEIIPVDDDDPDMGELCLRGPNVGLGYYQDEERTQKSFIQNPFQSAFREIVYKTGDLVWRGPQGHLHFRGRVDNQIKHLGYRIELEEIEAGFATLPFVNEVAVVYRSLGEGMGQIVAFLNLSEPQEPQEINRIIQTILPPYMVPKKIVLLDTLPKNKNGKINKVQLQEYLKTKSSLI